MPPRRPPRKRGDLSSNWWPPPAPPIPVVDGLQARSQRGRIGDTWWSQRFITVLESIGVGGRLQRGKRYARTGQVRSMDIVPGQVTSSVQGSRVVPYRVFIQIRIFTDIEWDAAEAVMASSAVFMAKLLAGDMPEEIEEAFVEASGSLFPVSADGFESTCSCPDWENPCKHIAAVYFLLAEAFDRDPFLIFAWRGRDKDQLLAGLRTRRRGGRAEEIEHVDGAGDRVASGTGPFGWPNADSEHHMARQTGDPMSVWGRDADLAMLEIRPRIAVAPDLILRQLDPEPLAGTDVSIIDALRPLYQAMTSGAADLALGEPEQENTRPKP
ncbi:MAG: SWIM zinc finger family protein [Acidimicrobiales bacterium]